MARVDGIVKLRKLTGLPFKLCKEAFDKYGGSISASLTYLERCGQEFEPLTKSLNNGVIFSYNSNNTFGLFSVKCTTDFAARSQTIYDISAKIGHTLCNEHSKQIGAKWMTGRIYHHQNEGVKAMHDEVHRLLKMASLTLKEQTHLSDSFIIHNPSPNDSVKNDGNRPKRFTGVYVHGSHGFKALDRGKLGTGGAIIGLDCQFKGLGGLTVKAFQRIADEIAVHLYSIKNLSKDMVKDAFQLPIIRVDEFSKLYLQIAGESGCSANDITGSDEVNLGGFIRSLSDLGFVVRLNGAGLLDLSGAVYIALR